MKKFDFKNKECGLLGFYEWNKNRFFLDKNDDRIEKFKKFKEENGFYPDETWNLYQAIGIFILPRLKYYRSCVEKMEAHPGCLKSTKEWQKILDKMIFAFQDSVSEDQENEFCKKYHPYIKYKVSRRIYSKKVEEGLKLFSKYFYALWN